MTFAEPPDPLEGAYFAEEHTTSATTREDLLLTNVLAALCLPGGIFGKEKKT